MMGWAARLNPRSFDGHSERDALHARLERFGEAFPTREAYELYLDAAGVTDEERIYMERFLPAHLTQTALVTES